MDGTVYPIADDIPVLLPDRDEQRRVLDTDWSQSTHAATPLAFYNQPRDHDAYWRSTLEAVCEDLKRYLPCAAAPSGPVLEIGSGKGALQHVAAEYVAVDYSFVALSKYISSKAQRICATAEHLPFADGTFRFIFSIATLEHVGNPDLAFDEIERVLKPGGVAYLHPAWHCTLYNCDGVAVRGYRDLPIAQRWIKLTLPMRRHPLAKAAAALPGRFARRVQWTLARGRTQLAFGRPRPNYETFWQSDSAAACRLDSHEACLYFHSRRYRILRPGPGTIRQLLSRHEPLVVSKPARSST